MEISTTTTSPLSSSSTPLSFFNNKHLKPSIPALNSWTNHTKTTNLHIKPIKSSFHRPTLSSNWEIEGATSASRLPTFDQLDIPNMLLRQRIIFLGFPIDDLSADYVISQLLLLDAKDSEKDIKLFINSPGGSINAGLGIYDAIKQCKADVSTVCMGLAASMGALLLASGTKGKRYCMPNSKVMIQQPLPPYDAESISNKFILEREWRYHAKKTKVILSRITGKSVEQIDSDTEYDFFMNPWEAKEYGLVDYVIDDGKPGLVAPIGDKTPPPMSNLFYLWQLDKIERSVEDLPSEHKLLRNHRNGGQGSDEEKGTSIEKDVSTPVEG